MRRTHRARHGVDDCADRWRLGRLGRSERYGRSGRNRGNDRRIGVTPRPHDAAHLVLAHRSGKHVRPGRGRRSPLPRRNAPSPLDGDPRPGPPRRVEPRQRLSRSRPARRGDRLPERTLPRTRPRPHRCRADDVRAGELRALPPQDLQRGVDRRWCPVRTIAVRHGPPHSGVRPGRSAVRVPRQCRRDARACGELVRSGSGHRTVPRRAGTGGDPHEGGDPQPPHRNLAPSGGGDRLRRRNSR